MKKRIWTVLALVMVCMFAFAACTSNTPAESSSAPAESSAEASSEAPAESSEAPSEEPSESAEASGEGNVYSIGFTSVSTQGDFLSTLATELTERFGARGDTFEVVSADGDVATQIEQIENFTTMGVDAILIFPVEATGLTDAIQKAMDQGVFVAAASGEPEVYDLFFENNEADSGDMEAQMAAEYINEKYADAEAGSVDIGLITYTGQPSAAERSAALENITQYTDKVNIVDIVDVDQSAEAAQAAAENMLLTYPDVKVILCYNGEQATGANEFAMSMSSPIEDKSDFAVFSVDISGPIIDMIKASENDESVYRGTVRMFASQDEMYQDFVIGIIDMIEGRLTSDKRPATLYMVRPEDLQDAAPAETE